MSEKDTNEIKIQLAKIEQILEDLSKTNDLKLENMEEKIKVANHRILDLEDTIRWLWRTVIGAIATGAIGILFSFIKIGGIK